jgi:alkylation response protein AidB-like acyl-CoA dehydrogenase
MNFQWNTQQMEMREAISRFARSELTGTAHSVDEFKKAWRKCADMGVQGLTVDTQYGGLGTDYLTTAAALEALGKACEDNGFLFSLNAHMWACQYPIQRFGSQEQKERYLPRLCDGTSIGAHGMSEPGSGSDAFSLTTTVTATEEGYTLRGSKTFVTNAPIADVFVVFARAPGTEGFAGISAFILDRDTDGLEVGPPVEKMGLEDSYMADVFFDDCEIPKAQLLGRAGRGAGIFVDAMEHERAMILASTVGSMERTFENSVAYARERRQFGQPISRFQAVSHRLADMKTRLEASRLLLYRLAWLLDQGEPVGLESAMVKLHLSESYVATAFDALQIHGGYGYLKEYGVERELRDAVGSQLYSGTSDIQRNLIARHLGL